MSAKWEGAKHWNRRKTWKCPYFRWDGERKVHCGHKPVSFPDRQKANSHMQKFCASYDWDRCPVAIALTEEEERHGIHW